MHEYSPFEVVIVWDPFSLPKEEVGRNWIEFVLRFFYLPESVGVTEAANNSRSSPGVGGFIGGSFFCYNGAGSIMKGAYKRFYSNDALVIVVIRNDTAIPSYAHLVSGEQVNSNVPEGRAYDSPGPMIYPDFVIFPLSDKERLVGISC